MDTAATVVVMVWEEAEEDVLLIKEVMVKMDKMILVTEVKEEEVVELEKQVEEMLAVVEEDR